MRANQFRVFHVACALAVGVWTMAHAVPVSENFEGITVGALTAGTYGNVTVTGSVDVVSGTFQGTNSLLLGQEEFSQGSVSMATSGNPSNVWALVYTIPGRSDGSYFGALEDDTAFAFGVDTNGSVHAFSSNTWHINSAGLESNVWVGFAINADYVSETYDLYVTTNGYLQDMERIFENLAYNTNYTGTSMSELRIETSVLQTYVDALSMQASYTTLPFGVGTNLMISMRQSSTVVPPPPYDYGAGSNKFDAFLGEDMKSGLQNGDTVRVFVEGAWQQYELDGGNWQSAGTFDQVDLANAIHIASVATPGFALFPYGTLPASPSADLTPSGVGNGWNHLVWPDVEKAATASSEWGFASQAGDGDRLIVYDETDGRTRIFGWNTGAWKDFPSLSSSTSYQLRHNQSFWYQRTNAVEGSWTPMD